VTQEEEELGGGEGVVEGVVGQMRRKAQMVTGFAEVRRQGAGAGIQESLAVLQAAQEAFRVDDGAAGPREVKALAMVAGKPDIQLLMMDQQRIRADAL